MNKNTIGYLAILFLLLITSFFSLNLFLRQRSEHDLLDIRAFPHRIGNWRGRDMSITEAEYKILETRNLIFREYTNAAKQNLYLFIVYSETNRSIFHPPEVCLIGSGVTINNKTSEKIKSDKVEFLANKLYLKKNEKNDLALYCYKVGNFYTDSYYLQQARFALNQLLARRRGGATIRVSMPMGESEEITLPMLKSFIKQAIETLEKL